MSHPSIYSSKDTNQNTRTFYKPYNKSWTRNNSQSINSKKLKDYSYQNIPMQKQLPQWNNSSSVLQNSVSLFSIPKQQRFKQSFSFEHGTPQNNLNYHSSLNKRSTNFGFGNKADVPQVFSDNKNSSRYAPFYEIDDMIRRRNKKQTEKKGKSIGVTWASFSQTRTPHRSTVHSPDQVKEYPGHIYDISSKTGENSIKVKMHERLRMFSEIRAYNKRYEPSPFNYGIKETQTARLSPQSKIGNGSRSDFTHNPQSQQHPGPSYNLTGFCDKFQKTKMKNIGHNRKLSKA